MIPNPQYRETYGTKNKNEDDAAVLESCAYHVHLRECIKEKKMKMM